MKHSDFLGMRRSTFEKAYELIKKHIDNKEVYNIVLGTSRSFVSNEIIDDIDYWKLHEPNNWPWSDGFFTKLFADNMDLLEGCKYRIYTVDPCDKANKVVRTVLKDNEHIEIIQDYWTSFLENFDKKVDFLYMDHLETREEAFRQHLENIFKLILERNFLHDDSIILIDNLPVNNSNSIPYFTENGYDLITHEYQALFVKKKRHTKVVNGVKYLINNENDIIQNILIQGLQWNNEIFHKIESYVKDRSLTHFLNVGAHIGSVALPISRLVKKVTAIEAYPPTYKHLCDNIKLNNISNVHCMNIALGDKEDTIYFVNDQTERLKNNSGGMHVLTEYDIYNNIRSGNLSDKRIMQKMDKLDNLTEDIDNFDIMLVDIEGFEQKFLMGAQKQILKNKPIIIIEIWNNWKRKHENMDTTQEEIIDSILSMNYKLVANVDDDFIFEPTTTVVEMKQTNDIRLRVLKIGPSESFKKEVTLIFDHVVEHLNITTTYISNAPKFDIQWKLNGDKKCYVKIVRLDKQIGWDCDLQLIIDEYVDDSVSVGISKQIHQTYHSLENIPTYINDQFDKYASDFTRVVYDDETSRKFIQDYFGNDLAEKYDNLHGCFKADFFRYCILYIKGGVYLDIKTLLTKDLNLVLSDMSTDHCMYTCMSISDKSIYQGIIATTPCNPFLKQAIHLMYITPVPDSYNVMFTYQLYDILSKDNILTVGRNVLYTYNKFWMLNLFYEMHDSKNDYPEDKYGWKIDMCDFLGNKLLRVRDPNYPY